MDECNDLDSMDFPQNYNKNLNQYRGRRATAGNAFVGQSTRRSSAGATTFSRPDTVDEFANS